MTDPSKNEDLSFGDIEEDDTYCTDDPGSEDLDWGQIAALQNLIDTLPKDGDARKIAVYDLQSKLSRDS